MMTTAQRLLLFLGLQSALVLIAATDLFIPFTAGVASGGDFWPLLNLSIIYDLLPLVTILVVYGLKKTVDEDDKTATWRKNLPANLIFMAGISLLLWSYELFDRWIFLGGVAVCGIAVMVFQAMYPGKEEFTGRDTALIAAEGVLLAVGLAANARAGAPEAATLILAGLALLAGGMLLSSRRSRGRQPLFAYYVVGCGVGFAAVVLG
jgi:hypothetical protein